MNSSIECEENDVVIEIFECLKDKFGKCLVDINNLTELEELIGSYKVYARYSIFSQLLKVPTIKNRKNSKIPISKAFCCRIRGCQK